MANDYYNASGAPADSSLANPAIIRSEFEAIGDGFDKLPILAGNADEAIFVNAAANALESKNAADARAALGAEGTANKDASGGYAGLTTYKINLKNAAGTITSFLTNTNTDVRTYTFPDNSGTVMLTSDDLLNGRKNWLINGNFNIWQRSITSHTTLGYGSDDRWYVDKVGSTFVNSRQAFTVGQTDVPDDPRYYCRMVNTSVANAANFINKQQRIEGVHNLSGQDVRLSFYCKADAIKNIAIEAVQNFGTGGAPSATVTAIDVTTIALTASWALYETTLTIPSIAGKTIGTNGNDYLAIVFWMDAGANFNTRTNTLGQQNGTFEFSHIQLEVGTVTTDLERRSFAEEIELCQRYFQPDVVVLFSGDVVSGSTYYGNTQFSVEMRAAPTATWANVVHTSFAAAVGTLTISTNGLREYKNANATANGLFVSSFDLDAEL